MKTWQLVVILCLVALRLQSAQTHTTLHTVDVTKQLDVAAFTGTITELDAPKFTMTITGHEVKDTIHQKSLVKGNASKPKPPAKDAAKGTPRHFHVDPVCRIVGPDKVPLQFSTLATNMVVVVKYTTAKDFERKTISTISDIVVTKGK